MEPEQAHNENNVDWLSGRSLHINRKMAGYSSRTLKRPGVGRFSHLRFSTLG
jgi:hypothetical protein